MLWCNVLDLHFAADQPDEVLREVAERCYRPLVGLLGDAPRGGVTMSVDGVLLERLGDQGMGDIIEGLGRLVEEGRVELTGSAAQNAILTALDEDEMKRAIEEHARVSRRVFGALFKPAGFFPPELSYSPAVGRAVDALGYEWVLVDETAADGLEPMALHQDLYAIEGTDSLTVFFRDRSLSTGILYRGFEGADDFAGAVGEPACGTGYLVTATAAEVYGYHHAGYEGFLAAVLGDERVESSTLSGLLTRYGQDRTPVRIRQSSWSPWATLQY